MAFNEATIRDNLANDLEVLEAGLALIETEHSLKNAQGTSGRIDILAKDRFGNRVIIEVKRSDASARQALHELFKYSSLYRAKEGLPYGSVRSILVSTEWNELRVPFAEYLRVAEAQCEGFELDVDANGKILKATKHIPAELSAPVKCFHEHSIFFFTERERCESVTSSIGKAFEAVGGTASVTIQMSYHGDIPDLPYPHALYFVPFATDPATWERANGSVKEQYEHLSDEPESEVRRCVEEELGHLHLQRLENAWDTFEIGYPEKLHSMLQLGWEIQNVERNGRVPSQSASDDAELARMISGVEGENSIYFFKISKPQLTVQWNELKENSEYCLAGNLTWEEGFRWYLERISATSPDSMVGVSIYNPMNLPIALYKILVSNDGRFLPQLEIVVSCGKQKKTEALLGKVGWDGKTCPQSVDQVFGSEQIGDFSMSAHLGCQAELDNALMRAHGLSYSLIVVDELGGKMRVREFDAATTELTLVDESTVSNGKSISDLINENREYFDSVASRLSSAMGFF